MGRLQSGLSHFQWRQPSATQGDTGALFDPQRKVGFDLGLAPPMSDPFGQTARMLQSLMGLKGAGSRRQSCGGAELRHGILATAVRPIPCRHLRTSDTRWTGSLTLQFVEYLLATTAVFGVLCALFL
jgi:hypothetical protein